ncbi:beta-lactamase-like protein 1 isoform X2 [Clytia hemisphaerica]|uniref:beta-lactamase-like protein 1 isoform X2 n=1 Tax=Clytia hemisphaerica TaxID=252671 RepID=UPI0034D5BA48
MNLAKNQVEPLEMKEDKLLTSVVHMMESNGTAHPHPHPHQDSKTNPAFHFTNGDMTMSESNKNFNNNGVHKPRKFSLPTGNSYPAKAPLDRMASVASSQFTTANSVLRLVSDDRVDGHTKPKTWFAFCKRKWPWILLYFSVVGIIVALTTMYVLEKRNNDFTATIMKGKEIKEPCFEREYARYIPNVKREAEIIKAIIKSKLLINRQFDGKTTQAYTIKVNYMGKEIWSDKENANFSSKFPIASLTKIFPVLMLHMLIADGTIKSIDDDVTKYEPLFDYKNPFNRKRITFRHLACMMSGLPREAPCLNFTITNFCPISDEEMYKRVRNITLSTHPGHIPAYSNLAFGILGSVLERLKNTTSSQWIMDNIINPLNMTETGFDILERRREFPESIVDGKLVDIVNWGWLTPTGGLYSSSNDLAKLGLLFTGNKTLPGLSKETIQRMLTPEYIWADGEAQGCPFEINKVDTELKKKIDYLVYSKDGSIFGYGAKFSIVRELQLNINVLAAHVDGSTNHIWYDVTKIFVKAFDDLLKRKGDNYRLPANPERFIGSYKLTSYWPIIKSPCNITLEDGMLFLNLEWMKAPLTGTDNPLMLKTGNYQKLVNNHACVLLGLGLLRMEFHFDPAIDANDSLPGFYVNGISFYGYVSFERIK